MTDKKQGKPQSIQEVIEKKIDIAMEYIEDHGWSIIPINPNTKRPALPSWKPYQVRPPSEDEVRNWLLDSPDSIFAVVTGAVSGICVVDCDNEDAEKKADELGMLSPIQASTKRGSHRYFRHPMDGKWRGPQSGRSSKGEVWPRHSGLDFRGDGSYAILPPLEGYSWRIAPDHDFEDMPLYVDYRASGGVSEGGQVIDASTMFSGLDLSAVGAQGQTTEEYVAGLAGSYPLGKIPRGGSGIYDLTFRFLGEAVLRVGLGAALESEGRRFMAEYFSSSLEESRFQQNLRSIRSLEVSNHPERFDEDGNYRGHLAPEPEPAPEPARIIRPLTTSDIPSLLAEAGAIQHWLSPWLAKPSITQIYGFAGCGKTLFLTNLLYHASLGLHFGPFYFTGGKPPKVLYFDWENGRGNLANRLQNFVDSYGDAGDNFSVWTPWMSGARPMNLNTRTGLAEFGEWIGAVDPDIIVIDTIRSAFSGMDENSTESWSRVNEIMVSLRNSGKSVIVLHHGNKPSIHGIGREAGSSNQLTQIETQIRLAQVYTDKTDAENLGGLCDAELPDPIWPRLRAKCPAGGRLQVVLEARYGKVREWTDEHERVQYIGFGRKADDKSFVVSSLSPQEKCLVLYQSGKSTAEIADIVRRSEKIVKGWLSLFGI